MKKNITLKFIAISIIVAIVVFALSFMYLRDVHKHLSINNAKTIANVINHYISFSYFDDNLKQVNSFFKEIEKDEKINQIWMVVLDDTLNISNYKYIKNKAYDDIDKKIIQTSKLSYKFDDGFLNTHIRISIPYNSLDNKVGFLSLDMKLSLMEKLNIDILYIIPILVFVASLFILISFRKKIVLYSGLFDNITNSLNTLIKGNFREVPYPNGLDDELKSTVNNLNKILINYKNTTDDIDKKLKIFIGDYTDDSTSSPLEKSRDIVTTLSNLYKFKKDIETAVSKDEIYEKLSKVLNEQFGLKNFNIVEFSLLKYKVQKVKNFGAGFLCRSCFRKEHNLSKFIKEKDDVVLVNYCPDCVQMKEQGKYPYRISLKITKEVYLILNFLLDNEGDLKKFKDNIHFIKSYIEESINHIEVHFLMQILKEQAFKDSLTSLYNRTFLDKYCDKIVQKAQRENYKIAVLLIDMDYFKAVNDEYGHDIGDKVLKELSRVLLESIKKTDIAIRYGGEEFLVLLPNINSEEDAINIANRIRINVSKNNIEVYKDMILRKTVSIGLSIYPTDSNNFDTVVKNADIALYEAKRQGRNKVIRISNDDESISGVDLF